MDDERMEDAEQELETLSNADFILMCDDAFDNLKVEEDLDGLVQEVETLFIPQLQERLPLALQEPEVFCSLAKNLCKSFTFLRRHEDAFACWRELESFLLQQQQRLGPDCFTSEAQELSVEISGVYVNMASLAVAKSDHAATIALYQKAADVILPWIFEQGDMSPVPSLLSVRTITRIRPRSKGTHPNIDCHPSDSLVR